jgi:hypothetical protein
MKKKGRSGKQEIKTVEEGDSRAEEIYWLEAMGGERGH